jgi:hypothetical protein
MRALRVVLLLANNDWLAWFSNKRPMHRSGLARRDGRIDRHTFLTFGMLHRINRLTNAACFTFTRQGSLVRSQYRPPLHSPELGQIRFTGARKTLKAKTSSPS